MSEYKPVPIGVRPKWTRQLERLRELQGGIDRYFRAELPIPVGWIQEYNELLKETKVYRENLAERNDR